LRSLQLGIKWTVDRVLAAFALVVLAPVFAAIWVWVRRDAGKPVFITQLRAGKDGVPFRLLKVRSMVPNAVQLGQQLGITDDLFGVVADDPRITKSGRVLRRTGLDELPQLVNILRGEMSVVGPRPDLVEQVANYTEADRRRLAVRPGLTGWSQTHGRDEIGWPERIEQDVWYIDHWSLWLDLKIVALTFAEVFRSDPEPVEDTMNIERARALADGTSAGGPAAHRMDADA
jgi:lipopolysaccharide/colanic/teichoic acid biosynthesis glycosyltransferase